MNQQLNRKRNKVRGETALLIVEGEEYSGNDEVLAGFFKYHKKACTSPELTNTNEDELKNNLSFVDKPFQQKLDVLTIAVCVQVNNNNNNIFVSIFSIH